MAKGTQYSQQFKEDAVRYKEEHPEPTYDKIASNLGLSVAALKSWIIAKKSNEGSFSTRSSRNYEVMKK